MSQSREKGECKKFFMQEKDTTQIDCMAIYRLTYWGGIRNQFSLSISQLCFPLCCLHPRSVVHLAAETTKSSLRLTVLITVRRQHDFFLRVPAKMPERSLILPPWHTCLSLNQSFCLGGLEWSDCLNLAMCLELPKPHRVAGHIFNFITFCRSTCWRDLGVQHSLRTLAQGGGVGTAVHSGKQLKRRWVLEEIYKGEGSRQGPVPKTASLTSILFRASWLCLSKRRQLV